MDKGKILKYIEDGEEKGLLDKLRSYSLEGFNKQFENLLRILLVMIEKANDPIASHQFLYKAVLTFLPEIVVVKEKLAAFIELLKLEAISPYQQTSFIVREFIIGVEDKKFEGAEYEGNKITSEQLSSFKSKMIELNIFFLQEAIDKKLSHENIMSIFYSCVEKLEAERRIIINKKAIELLREYLKSNPEGYVTEFIRPLYSGGINSSWPEYYLHVAEPFNTQIFNKDFSFDEFLTIARSKGINEKLIDDINVFYEDLKHTKEIDGNKSIQLKNSFNNFGLELKSKEHHSIRPELKN